MGYAIMSVMILFMIVSRTQELEENPLPENLTLSSTSVDSPRMLTIDATYSKILPEDEAPGLGSCCCPIGCLCDWTMTICSKAELTSVPQNLLITTQTLNLSFNNIRELPTGTFSNLLNLTILDLSKNRIQEINERAFAGLIKLERLILSFNPLKEIHPSAFSNLSSLEFVDLRGNFLIVNLLTRINHSGHLNSIAADDPLVCCMIKNLKSCESGSTVFSLTSCYDLLDFQFARVLLWCMAIIVVLGNMAVIVTKRCKGELKKTSSILVLNLALADFLLSIYLIIILAADIAYRHEYIENHTSWRNGLVCQTAGFIFTLSTEVSILTLAWITIERLLVICRPDLGVGVAYHPILFCVVCLVTWLMAVALSAVPLAPVSHFGGQFYSWSPLCLPFHLIQQRLPGWDYSTALLLGLNLTSLLIVVGGYSAILLYSIARLNSDTQNILPAKEMVVLILVDCCCWIPVMVVHVMAIYSDSSVDTWVDLVYTWVALFVVPINPVFNPFIYTLIPCRLRPGVSLPDEEMTTIRQNGLTCHSVPVANNNVQENIMFVETRGTLENVLEEGARLTVADIHTLLMELNQYMAGMRMAGIKDFVVNESTVLVEQTRDTLGRTEQHFWLQSPSPEESEGNTPQRSASRCSLNPDLDHDDHVCELDDSVVQLTDLVSRLMRRMNYN